MVNQVTRRLLIAVCCILSSLLVCAADTPLRQSRAGYYSAETRLPKLKGSGPLQSLAASTCKQWARKAQSEFVRESKKAFHDLGKPRQPFDYSATGKVTYQSPSLVSIQFDTEQYNGGAHGMSYYNTFTFGMVNGKAKALKLADFFAAGSGYPQLVSDAVIAKLKQKEGAAWVIEGEVKKLVPGQLERFVVVPDGLMFLFNPYEVGPYSSGSFEIKLTAAELGPDFKKMLISARTAPHK